MPESSTPDKLEAILSPDPELEGCIETLLAELPAAAEERPSSEIDARDIALIDRYKATMTLAERLADGEKGEKAAQTIIAIHGSKGEQTPSTLYAYWSVAKRLEVDYPDSLLPRTFLEFLRDLAQKVDAKDLLPEINDLIIGLRIDPEEKEEEQTPQTPLERLQDLSDRSWREFTSEADYQEQNFAEQVCRIYEECYDIGVPHSSDYLDIVKNCAIYLTDSDDLLGDLEKLKRELNEAKLLGEIEQRELKAVYDELRLHAREDDVEGLLEDIRDGKFMSREGLRAAMAKNDRLRLQGGTEEIREDIENNRFVTQLGLIAARRYYDAERLQAVSHRTNHLFVDIWQVRFTTKIGTVAAKEQHDQQRLAFYLEYPEQLLMALESGTFPFFSPEGKEEVQKLLATLGVKDEKI